MHSTTEKIKPSPFEEGFKILGMPQSGQDSKDVTQKKQKLTSSFEIYSAIKPCRLVSSINSITEN